MKNAKKAKRKPNKEERKCYKIIEEDVDAYKEQKRKTKNIYRQVKRQFYEKNLEKVENHYKTNNNKNFYQEIKTTRKGQQVKDLFYKNKNGKLVGDEVGAIGIWKDYFKEILNAGEGNSKKLRKNKKMYGDRDEIEVPSREEIEKIISRMKNGKAPGENGITAELIKCGGSQLNTEVYKLIVEIWRREEIPATWRKAKGVPRHKKGDRKE